MDNIINARRVRILNLSTFDCLTDTEHAQYNAYSKCGKKEDREQLQITFNNMVETYTDVRKIEDKCIFKIKNNISTGEYREDKQIALFESELIRIANDLSTDFPLVKQVVYLDICHNEILKQILNNGVMINDKKYIVYSSSTGQQKKKMVTLLEEEFYINNIGKIMCGLSIEKINNNERVKGCNRGKYLAYTSLPLSSSIEISRIDEKNPNKYEIDIDKCIVVPDFKTNVEGTVNFLDMNTLKTEPKEMKVPIEHMDGSGIFLPGVLPASGQIRGGWFKGALFPFPFDDFIEENKCNPIIPDIYGKPHDVIAEGITCIFTGSQLKMWKYYKDWDEYKKCFKENGCEIYVNNLAHTPDKDSIVRLSYQFLQTLSKEKLTDETLKVLCQLTLKFLIGAKRDKDIMYKMMGIVDEEEQLLDSLQTALKLYPDMLYDNHVRTRIEKTLRSEQHRAMAGKLLVEGFYSYICPDLYAFCEWLFMKKENPIGLIPINHVYNSYYNDSDIEMVDVLRSPHLSDAEHGIRNLIKSDKCKRWFSGTDTVVSTHDLLSKTLMNDWDGDECLITSSKELIALVDESKVPLYYEMEKAKEQEITPDVLYDGLCSSFKNSIIGDISNSITKLWNVDGEIDLECIRVLTAYNNFMIDYPKTHYKPSLQQYETVFEDLRDNKKIKAPYFFHYAKDKKLNNCEKANSSNVNRISMYIKKILRKKENANYKLFDGANEFNPNYLLDEKIKVDRNSIQYSELMKTIYSLKKKEKYMAGNFTKAEIKLSECDNFTDEHLKYNLFDFFCHTEIMKLFDDRKVAATYLADIEYYQPMNETTCKNILWNCFGDILLLNISSKLNNGEIPRFKRSAYQTKKKKDKEITEEIAKATDQAMKESTIIFTKEECEWIDSQEHRKDCATDRLLLYILLHLQKKSIKDNKYNTFNIMINTKTKGITPANINKWIGTEICKRGLERLKKKNLIECELLPRKQYKVKLLIPYEPCNNNIEECNIYFKVVGGNPLVQLFKVTEERKVKECEICGQDFIAEGNNKTCSSICKKKLEKQTKAKNNQKVS